MDQKKDKLGEQELPFSQKNKTIAKLLKIGIHAKLVHATTTNLRLQFRYPYGTHRVFIHFADIHAKIKYHPT